jgi:hypothetical protein
MEEQAMENQDDVDRVRRFYDEHTGTSFEKAGIKLGLSTGRVVEALIGLGYFEAEDSMLPLRDRGMTDAMIDLMARAGMTEAQMELAELLFGNRTPNRIEVHGDMG